MPIQLVVVAKPELFESGQIAEWFHNQFRSLTSFSFPSDVEFDFATLTRLAKQVLIAYWRMEFGEDFFEGKAPITSDFFDRWWIIKLSDDIPESDLIACDDLPALNLLDALDRPVREQIFLMQSDDVRASLEEMLRIDYRPQGPQAGGLLYAETKYFTPFPAPETVFAETHKSYMERFYSLCPTYRTL